MEDAPLSDISVTYSTVPLSLGSVSDEVRIAQLRLNRISRNYPAIPKIEVVDGIFGSDTDKAVRRFQEIFGLTPDGIIGKSTWYYIRRIYNSVKRLSELDSEGVELEEITSLYSDTLREGDTGDAVRDLQYYIDYLSDYYETIPSVAADGIYGPATRAAVIDIENTFGLVADGILDRMTWQAIYNAYLGIISTIPLTYTEGLTVPFPGVILRLGAESAEVRLLQEYLNYVAGSFPEIPTVSVTGYFGPRTEESVKAFQRVAGLDDDGLVTATVWRALTDLYRSLYDGDTLGEGQYPGYDVGA